MKLRRLSPEAIEKMKQFYLNNPEYKEFVSTPEFYHNLFEKKESTKPKKLVHYSPIDEDEKAERRRTI
jgi:hypothetical protein